jgi:mono/diheme cytochrome c family protein
MGQIARVKLVGVNFGNEPVEIERILSSCGCTSTDFRKEVISPKKKAVVEISITTNQKIGQVSKAVRIYFTGNNAPHKVTVKGTVLPTGKFDHAAETKKVSIFFKDCASCHVTPGENKYGERLYMTDCAFCHGTNRQGGYAPPLISEMPHWYQIITKGTGVNMPGFLKDHGGPRTEGQITSLMNYLKNPSPTTSSNDTSLSGRRIYSYKCSVCHGSRQLGGIAPSLKEELPRFTTESLSQLLKEGTDHLMMPSFLKEKGGSMTDEEIDKLCEYLINGK